MIRLRGRKLACFLIVVVVAALIVALVVVRLLPTRTIDAWGRGLGDLWAVHVSMPVVEVKPRMMGRTLVDWGWVEIDRNLAVDGEFRLMFKVPAGRIERLNSGMPVRITFEGFPERSLPGKVAEISPLPDPSHGGSLQSVYTVRVKVDHGFPGLRSGMRAEVKILLDGIDEVLGVPVQAVDHFEGEDHVAYRKPDGGFAWHDVTTGVPVEGFVEIVRGLQGGELLALRPQALIRREKAAAVADRLNERGIDR